MGPGLHIAVNTLPVAKVFGVPEDKRFGSDIEDNFGDIDFDLGDNECDLEGTEFDLEGTGLQDIVPGSSGAGAVRPGSALVGLDKCPEGSFDCCIRGWVAGYRLALLLLPLAGQPLRFSSADRLRRRV